MSFHFPVGFKSSRWSTFVWWLSYFKSWEEATLHTFPISDDGLLDEINYTDIEDISLELPHNDLQSQSGLWQQDREKKSRETRVQPRQGMNAEVNMKSKAEHDRLHPYLTLFTQ